MTDDDTLALIARLEAENKELRRDALRYRWLRDCSHKTWVNFQKQWLRTSEQCDAAIDAAMERKERE